MAACTGLISYPQAICMALNIPFIEVIGLFIIDLCRMRVVSLSNP
jgi:hypothetical protein